MAHTLKKPERPDRAAKRPPIVDNYLLALGDGSFNAAVRFTGETSERLIRHGDFYSFEPGEIGSPALHHIQAQVELDETGWVGLKTRIKCSYRRSESRTAFDNAGRSYDDIARNASFFAVRARELDVLDAQYPGTPDDCFGDEAMRDVTHAWALGTAKNIRILADLKTGLWEAVKLRLGAVLMIGGLVAVVINWVYWQSPDWPISLKVAMTVTGLLTLIYGGLFLPNMILTWARRELKRLNGTFVNTTQHASQQFGEIFRSRQSTLDSLNKECLELGEKAQNAIWGGPDPKTWSALRWRYWRVAIWTQRRIRADHRVLELQSEMIPRAYVGFTARAQFASHFHKLWLPKGWITTGLIVVGAFLLTIVLVIATRNGWIPWKDLSLTRGFSPMKLSVLSAVMVGAVIVRMVWGACRFAEDVLAPQNEDDVFKSIEPARPQTAISDDHDVHGLAQIHNGTLRQMRENTRMNHEIA